MYTIEHCLNNIEREPDNMFFKMVKFKIEVQTGTNEAYLQY